MFFSGPAELSCYVCSPRCALPPMDPESPLDKMGRFEWRNTVPLSWNTFEHYYRFGARHGLTFGRSVIRSRARLEMPSLQGSHHSDLADLGDRANPDLLCLWATFRISDAGVRSEQVQIV